MKVKRICETCGTEFYVYPCIIKEGKGRFCSRKCFCNLRITKVKRICKQCGKVFKTHPSKIKQGGGKFCSRECHAKWQSRNLIGKDSPRWKPKIKRICHQCGKEFEIYPNQIERGKFCSEKCYGKWRSQHFRNENSPNWQGGISFEPYCQKFNNKFKEYIRDKFGRVCFLCQKGEEENGRKLSVHHVNYNKDCGCDNDEACQFVPLCISCNSKVNYNRNMWEAKIKAMMQNKLNGWYI